MGIVFPVILTAADMTDYYTPMQGIEEFFCLGSVCL